MFDGSVIIAGGKREPGSEFDNTSVTSTHANQRANDFLAKLQCNGVRIVSPAREMGKDEDGIFK